MRGRLPKPLETHLAEGTFRADRHGGTVADAFDGTPEAPSGLSGDARAFWDSVVPELIQRGVAKRIDAPALEVMATLWARYRQAVLALEADLKDVAARRALVAYAAEWGRWAARFGLSPADRCRIPAAPAPVEGVSSRQRYPKDVSADGVRRMLPSQLKALSSGS